jgi:hypothetical protein
MPFPLFFEKAPDPGSGSATLIRTDNIIVVVDPATWIARAALDALSRFLSRKCNTSIPEVGKSLKRFNLLPEKTFEYS